MRPATQFISRLNQAVGDVVGIGVNTPVVPPTAVEGISQTTALVPSTSNSTSSSSTTTRIYDSATNHSPEDSAGGAEDQGTPLSTAGEWNTTYSEQVLIDDSAHNLKMITYGNEFFLITPEDNEEEFPALKESRQNALQQMCDAMTRMDSRLHSHSTTLTRMENHILETDDRVTVVESAMKSLQHAAASTASWRSTMEASARKMADQLTRVTNEGGASNSQRGDTSNSSFFIRG